MKQSEAMTVLKTAVEVYTELGDKAKTRQMKEITELIAAVLRFGYLLIKDKSLNNGSSRQSVLNSFDRAIDEISKQAG